MVSRESVDIELFIVGMSDSIVGAMPNAQYAQVADQALLLDVS